VIDVGEKPIIFISPRAMKKLVQKMSKNSLKKIRESLMMSKTELVREANISPNTITRIESGMSCRMKTKRKIILALGLKISDKNKVFGEDME
jgi:DNA-binding XRE family transcriptional regulator